MVSSRIPALCTVLVALGLLATSCSGPDYSTPRAAVETAQEALRNNNAERLYDSFTEGWRSSRLDRWRSRIKNLPPEMLPENGTPETMSSPEVFERYLRTLRKGRRTNELLKLYANAKFTITRESDTQATVTVESRFPLPYERGTLREVGDRWKIDGIK